MDIELVKSQNYICFLDETLDCITPYTTDNDEDVLNKYDINVLIDNYCSVGDDGLLKWEVPDYDSGRFVREKRLIENNRMIYNDGQLLLIFPISVLMAFKKLYILTYLFDGSIMYCYLLKHGINYKRLYITGESYRDVMFTDSKELQVSNLINYREYINILDDAKLNAIGNDQYSLSVGWYQKRATNEDLKRLNLNMRNFFEHKTGDKNKDCMWTTFASYKDDVLNSDGSTKKYNRYKKCFVPINKRASNENSNCTSVAYLVNRYMNVSVSSYFKGCGVSPKEDLFALSEMIQFIWRSAIRNNRKISVYIPSVRMRSLLQRWLDDNSNLK